MVQELSGKIGKYASIELTEPGLIKGLDDLRIDSGFNLTQFTPGNGQGLLRIARAKYDFAVDGGAQGAITPALTATIPDNAIIIGGTINSTTAATSGGSATISVGTTAGSSATSLLGATAVASFSLDAKINSAATFAAPVKMTAAGNINITVATADLTAGVIEVTILYFVAGA